MSSENIPNLHEKKIFTVVSETRHLFQYFMFADTDVRTLEDYFMKLSGDHEGVLVQDLIDYLRLDKSQFYVNFLSRLRNDDGYINYNIFAKVIVICSFYPFDMIIINCYKYFEQIYSEEKPLANLLNLFSIEELDSVCRGKIKIVYKCKYGKDFTKFVYGSCLEREFFKFFHPFHQLCERFRSSFLSRYQKESIIYRITNYETMYHYYVNNNHSYLPLSICNQLYRNIFDHPNPNIFNYFFTPEKRKFYYVPFIFSQACIVKRSYAFNDSSMTSSKIQSFGHRYDSNKIVNSSITISYISTPLQNLHQNHNVAPSPTQTPELSRQLFEKPSEKSSTFYKPKISKFGCRQPMLSQRSRLVGHNKKYAPNELF